MGVQIVVDTNCLQSDRLARFLEASRTNFAVMPDYVSMEMHNLPSPDLVRGNYRVLSGHSRQVKVLKGTRVCCSLHGRAAGLRRRLIDARQSVEFPKFAAAVANAESRSDALLRQRMTWGKRDIERLNESAEGMAVDIPQIIEEVFSDADLAIIRRGARYPLSLINKLMDLVFATAWNLFDHHPDRPKLPPPNEMINTVIFRFALCMALQMLRWVRTGRDRTAGQQRWDRVRSDMVDSHIAAYGTFFDGIMTEDRKVESVHGEAAFLLPILATRPAAHRPLSI